LARNFVKVQERALTVEAGKKPTIGKAGDEPQRNSHFFMSEY